MKSRESSVALINSDIKQSEVNKNVTLDNIKIVFPENVIKYEELTLQKRISQGRGNTEVYQGTYNGLSVAIKRRDQIPGDSFFGQSLNYEYQVLNQFKSPYIIKSFGYTITPSCLVLEYMPKADLELYLQQGVVNWYKVLGYAVNVINGIKVLHDAKRVHRDIKPGNILINETGAKISDLEYVSPAEEKSFDLVGTFVYLAPEIFAKVNVGGTKDQPIYTMSKDGVVIKTNSDIYSFGMVLLEICTHPGFFKHYLRMKPEKFYKVISEQVFHNNTEQSLKTHPKHFSSFSDYRKLILDCINIDPEKRPKAQEVIDRLEVIYQKNNPDKQLAQASLFKPDLVRQDSNEDRGCQNSCTIS